MSINKAAGKTSVALQNELPAAGIKQPAFNVDASGQASYSIKINVPPGIAGLQPDLALVYNHRQSNGVMGIGWGLSGLSAVTRTKATYAVDGFNGAVDYSDKDRYILDGQRLINVRGDYGQPGTVYYTELQSWKYILAGSSPADGFTVTTRNGQIWKYGTTEDSCILADGSNDVRVWALHSIEDTNGNRIEYHYTLAPLTGGKASGAYYVDSISYSVRDNLAANRFIQFIYEDRPDPIASYIGGYQVLTQYRLKQVDVSIDDNELVSSYVLAYEQSTATQLSRLIAITQLGAASDGSPSLPATQILWQDTTNPGFDIGPTSVLDQHLNQSNIQPMDVSGRGLTDIVQLWVDDKNNIHATTYLATADTGGTTFVRATDSTLGSFPETRQFFAADVNGDGRTDLLLAYQNGTDNSLHLAVFLSDGESFTSAGVFKTGDSWTTSHLAFFAMDVNGDGRTDLVEAYAHYDPDQGQLLYFRSYLSKLGDGSGEMFTEGIVSTTDDPAYVTSQLNIWPMDVNGDGMMDIVRVWQDGTNDHIIATAYISVSNAMDDVTFAQKTETDLGTFSLQNQIAFLPADVNGDGIQDLLQIWQEPGTGSITLHLSTFLCDAKGGFVPGPDSTFKDQTINKDDFYPMGFSGGGQTNLMCKWISGNNDLMFTVYAASPQGTFRLVTDFNAGTAGTTVENAYFFAGDVNGDGKADLIRISSDQHQQIAVVPYSSTGAYPDLVTTITNQLGGVTSIQYAPITDSSVYTSDNDNTFPKSQGRRYPNPLTPVQFPVQAVLGQAIYVVSGYSEYNDTTVNRFSYFSAYKVTYTDAQVDLSGRGWEGFKTVTKLNLSNGLKTTQVYNLDFPFTGTLLSSITAADGTYATDPRVPKTETDVLMQVTSSEYQSVVRATGATDSNQQVLEVLETTHQTAQYDYGADNFDYALGSTYSYDDYGNRTQEVYLGYIDLSTKQPLYPDEVVYRYNLYQNDILSNGWALGYLLYAKVSANDTDPNITEFAQGDYHLEQRTYTSGTYNLETQGSWDNVHNKYFTSGYTYDEYGNKLTETAPGGAVSTYTYETDYNTYLMTKTLPANKNGQQLSTAYGYDPRFGTLAATQNENNFVFITSSDAFGRKSTQQGPVPDITGAQSDTNTLTSLVTGTTDLKNIFLSAEVVTIETTGYENDGAGGCYTITNALQSFPTDTTRDFLWKKDFSDVKGRSRETVQQSGQDAGNIISLTDYNGADKPILQALPFFATDEVNPVAAHVVVYTYDVLDRPITRTVPSGEDGNTNSLTTWYYGTGGIITETTASGSDCAYTQVFEHHFYDGKDKVKQFTIPGDDNAVTSFIYDGIARLLKTTDPATTANPGGVSNTIIYNSLDQKLSIDNPDQNTTNDSSIKALAYSYDESTGLLLQQTDAAGQTITYDYDLLGRVTTKTFSDGRAINYTYDGVNGKGLVANVIISAADQSIESAQYFSYDKYGNNNSLSLTIEGESDSFVTSSVFDPQKRLISQVQPDNATLSRTYESGVLTSQVLDGARVDYPVDEYNALGKFGKMVYGQDILPGSGVVTEYTFNPAGLLYGEKVYNDDGTLLQLSYDYDMLNQMLSITDINNSDQSQSFTYLNKRFATANTPGFDDGNYAYDASGNIISKNGGTYTYNAHFALTINAGDGTEIYSATQDACGRMKTRVTSSQSLVFEYNGMGCLDAISTDDGTVLRSILSDYLGNRIRETRADGTTILYINPFYKITRDSQQTATAKIISDSLGVVASIAATAGDNAGDTKEILYFRRDHKGSVTLSFDASGAIASKIIYDGYGASRIVEGANDFDIKYESRQWDEDISLYYFGARYYDPFVARFITPDTQVGASSFLQADALNHFAFELNNPINYVDPSGHSASWVAGLIIGLAILAAGILILATMGTAAPVVAALGATGAGLATSVFGTAFVAAGVSASAYSLSHTKGDSFSWKNFGIQTGISFGVGMVSGGLFFGLAAATSGISVLASIGWNALGGAVISGAADVSSQLFTNLAEGAHASDGLATAAIFGVIFGGAGGAIAGKFAGSVEEAVGENTPLNRLNLTRNLYEERVLNTEMEVSWRDTSNEVKAMLKANVRKAIWTQVIAANLTPLPEAFIENDWDNMHDD